MLIDPKDGHVLWTMDHPSRPVSTPGVVNLGDTYTIAAQEVMEGMLTATEPHVSSVPVARAARCGGADV